ncbi:Fic family protein [Mycoplasmopsis canis]|uniref:Fic family protein n=1 Tax=Mycoplasmopsis cynos TaxID=171284 RepID=UPI002AFE2063|nr:Fic family protein [Mycoplasmopsis cynos]WQQ12891.1 Fic family protein [Mycoplasmopsis cynos]WQQ13780.1 Fic family protein [Mycoplasmopsis cynos]
MKLNKHLSKLKLKEIIVILSHSSNALEGNSFTLNETRNLFEGNTNNLESKKQSEIIEMNNYKNSIDFIFNNFEKLAINNKTITNLHKIIMYQLLSNNGEFRKHNVRIANSNVLPYDWCVIEYKLNNLNDWYYKTLINCNNDKDKENLIYEYHAKFEKIHPFSDGNGRTGRAIVLLQQFQNNLKFKYIDIKDKKFYIDALEEYQLSGDVNDLNNVFK